MKRLDNKKNGASEYDIYDECSEEDLVEIFNAETERDIENIRRYVYLKALSNSSYVSKSDVDLPNITSGHASHVKMKCDNYTVETDYANSAGNSAKVNNHTVKSDVPENAKFTDTWRPLGTTADTACAGNDSRLSNARPASDVYAWAKQSSKPSYTASEVGAAAANHTHSNYMSSIHEVVSSSEPTNQSVGDYWIKRIK